MMTKCFEIWLNAVNRFISVCDIKGNQPVSGCLRQYHTDKDYDFTWISGLSAFIYGSFILRCSVFLLSSSPIVVTRSAISPR